MKRFLSFLLTLTMLASMFSFAVSANELGTVVFYDAADGSVVTKLDDADSIYANTTFIAKETGTASVIAAHYDIETGALAQMEFINTVDTVAGDVVSYNTPAISVADTDMLKVFTWSGTDTLVPLTEVGMVYRHLLEDLPTATVTELDVAEITDVPLTFAMNFVADPATEAQLAFYGNWYADYEITINKTATFNSDGSEDGYLAGQYDEWSPAWVQVPKMDITLNADTPLKIMETAAESYGKPGLKYTYAEVYERVKDFDCGIYFDNEFLLNNPDLEVTLALKIYNPADETESYVIGEAYTFTWEKPAMPTATVTQLNVAEIEDVDLNFALNFKADEITAEQYALYGNWYADYELTVSETATFNANGGADGFLSGQYDGWSENWVSVPFEDATLQADTPIRVMETAAALMGQSGLKLTYADIVTSVQDFNCGLAFTPEFLAAHDGLEVTLALKMYNPYDETESYIIGEEYKFTWKLPTATVTELDVSELPVDLDFALNFKADDVTEEQMAMFANWYADYELTVNKTATFNANGTADGYLSGQYDGWSENWVSVPFEDATLEADTPIRVMETAAALMGQSGLKLTCADIYTAVKDFNCGLAFTPEFLVNNPDLEVTLALKIYNPADETQSYVIGRTYTYTPDSIPSIDKFIGKDVTYTHTLETVEANTVTYDFDDLFTTIGGVPVDMDNLTVTGATYQDGKITVEGFGEKVITVTDNYYCNVATATVTVNEPANVDKFVGKDIEVTHTLDTIESGKYTVDFADLFDTNDYEIKEITVTGGTYADGKVTVEGLGTITVTATDNYYCNVATATVTVNEPANVDKFVGKDIEVTHTLDTIESGKYTVDFADLFDTNGYAVKEITVTGGTYADGKVTVEGLGTITVTATDNFYCNVATATVTVAEPANVDKFTGNTVTKQHTVFTIEDGVVTATLEELFQNNGYEVKEVTVGGDGTYADGVVSFAGTGTFTVTITDNFYCNTATATVVVNAPVAVDKWTGNTVTYTHTLDTIEANTVTFDFAELFTAIDGVPVKDITVEGATYQDGKVTVTGTGTKTITATDNYYCNTATATVTINAPANVTKWTAKSGLAYETEAGVAVTKTLGDLFSANGNLIKDANVTVTGASSFTKGATWSAGTVTFAGEGTYTVTITDSFYCSATSATVTVTEAAPAFGWAGVDKHPDVDFDIEPIKGVSSDLAVGTTAKTITVNAPYAGVYLVNVKTTASAATTLTATNQTEHYVTFDVAAATNKWALSGTNYKYILLAKGANTVSLTANADVTLKDITFVALKGQGIGGANGEYTDYRSQLNNITFECGAESRIAINSNVTIQPGQSVDISLGDIPEGYYTIRWTNGFVAPYNTKSTFEVHADTGFYRELADAQDGWSAYTGSDGKGAGIYLRGGNTTVTVTNTGATAFHLHEIRFYPTTQNLVTMDGLQIAIDGADAPVTPTPTPTPEPTPAAAEWVYAAQNQAGYFNNYAGGTEPNVSLAPNEFKEITVSGLPYTGIYAMQLRLDSISGGDGVAKVRVITADGYYNDYELTETATWTNRMTPPKDMPIYLKEGNNTVYIQNIGTSTFYVGDTDCGRMDAAGVEKSMDFMYLVQTGGVIPTPAPTPTPGGGSEPTAPSELTIDNLKDYIVGGSYGSSYTASGYSKPSVYMAVGGKQYITFKLGVPAEGDYTLSAMLGGSNTLNWGTYGDITFTFEDGTVLTSPKGTKFAPNSFGAIGTVHLTKGDHEITVQSKDTGVNHIVVYGLKLQ